VVGDQGRTEATFIARARPSFWLDADLDNIALIVRGIYPEPAWERPEIRAARLTPAIPSAPTGAGLPQQDLVGEMGTPIQRIGSAAGPQALATTTAMGGAPRGDQTGVGFVRAHFAHGSCSVDSGW
jgi:hypothetical protein